MDIIDEVIDHLKNSPGSTSTAIAQAVGVEKQKITSLLRNDMKDIVKPDGSFGWILEDINTALASVDVNDEVEGDSTMQDNEFTGDDITLTHGFAFDSLAAVRKKLLDLTGKNALLNYRHPKSSCLRIIDELPDQIHQVMDTGKSFTFIPVPEPTERELIEAGYIEIDPLTGKKEAKEYPTAEKWAKYLGLNISYELPPAEAAADGEQRHQDTKLQSLLYAPELESRLRALRSKAESAIEESGSNILFLSLGFLEWYESRDSDVARNAPLFTLPVKLEREKLDRSQGIYRYTITLKDDGLISNITLMEKLAQDFDLVLPQIEEDTTPEAYFQHIENTILNHQPRWRIRRQASLVLLNFSKQLMYQDLDPDNWPKHARIDQHELIKSFFSSSGDSAGDGGLGYDEEHEIDQIADIHTKFPLIYDADSSQHSALIDAVQGHNLVIEGPPGTGKSQTITNLIAACIANGKKVLFVAEKMAALDVVKDRLDRAGLGDFCLELHSHKSNKLKILQDLQLRLNKQSEYRPPAEIQAEIERHEDLKDKLITYAEEINKTWRKTGLTVHQILNRATRYREHFGINPEILEISNIDGWSLTTVRQKELVDDADMLADIYDQVSEQARDGDIRNHYWYGVQNTELMSYQADELNQALHSWTESLEEIEGYWHELISELKINTPEDTSFNDITLFNEALAQLPELSGDELLNEMSFIHEKADAFNSMFEQYKSLHDELSILSETINSDYIDKPSITDEIDESIKSISKLGLSFDVTLDDINRDIQAFRRLNENISIIKKQFDQIQPNVPDDLKVCFEVSQQGLSEFPRLIRLINSLDSELWHHRNAIFDNPDIDGLLEQLSNKIGALTPIYTQLFDHFSLHRLPLSIELQEYKNALDTGGIFRVFSTKWRKARSAIVGLSATAKPDKKKLISLLPSLVTYAKGVEEIDALNQESPMLQEQYRSIETPMDRIIELRKWYKAVRDEYGIGFGERVAIGNALLTIDRNLANSIVNTANHGLLEEVVSCAKDMATLVPKYKEYHLLKPKNAALGGEACPVGILLNVLSEKTQVLTKAISTGDKSIRDVRGVNERLYNLHNNIGTWLKNEVTLHFVPKIIPLSVRYNEYSQKNYNTCKKTLDIANIIYRNEALTSAFEQAPGIDHYNALRGISSELAGRVKAVAANEAKFKEIGQVNLAAWIEQSGDKIPALTGRNRLALEHPNWLNTWLDYSRLREKLISNGLDKIISSLEAEQIETSDLRDIIQLVAFHQLAKEILTANPYFNEFSGLEQNAIRNKFKEYDKKLLGLQRQRVAFQASREKPIMGNSTGRVSTYSEVSLIKHEAGKKTRHVALRSLLDRAGMSIQALKPCFMMSPMSVAQYLIPGKFQFDIVVMDEASQIRPEDALGAIARGDGLVVVGDPKQLPPTMFFNKTLNNDDADDAVALEESESILESVIPMFKSRRLRWHYRSQHESLIAFSNQFFYDSNLVIFPSPFQSSPEYGIRFKRVRKGRFHQSRNVEEAGEVVAAAAIQLKEHPDESVGIVAMNSNQQAEIEIQLEQAVKDDPLLSEAWDRNRATDEPLFIKNLENVQGDERDVIIISMTYGPETIGGRVMQRFGPINSNVGWRRLNVLFTRSKKRMHIFSSMGSGDIQIEENKSKGVKALRYFLEYCETGHLHHVRHTGKAPDSDFEVAVINALEDHGYTCEPQLGVAGYYLDIAIKDPGKPGHYLLAVECDGATYHSAKSARDRDRLRQEVLENLGWRIRRIWSTDWFKNPQAQIQPILQELEKLRTPVEAPEFELVQDSLDLAIAERDTEYHPRVESVSVDEVETEVDTYLDDDSDLELKDRLAAFSKNVIEPKFPDVEDEHRLLRPAMMEALIAHLPCSKSEFRELIPAYLREATDVEEARHYLGEVLEIVADYG